MIDHLVLFVYIISVGLTFSVTSLSMLFWLLNPNRGRLNTFLFIAYLTLMLLFAGIRFYWEELLTMGNALVLGVNIAEAAGYALILFYLPFTVNKIIGRKWSGFKLSAAITATAVYFGLALTYLLTGTIRMMALGAAMIYIVALVVTLSDIVMSIPRIQQTSSRIIVLSITLITVVFLPLIFAGRFLADPGLPVSISYPIRFLLFSLYHFWMALTGDIFYVMEISSKKRALKNLSRNLPLTLREKSIANSLVKGLTYNEIAGDLGISPNTVRNHTANLYKKLSVRSKVELIGVLSGERALS